MATRERQTARNLTDAMEIIDRATLWMLPVFVLGVALNIYRALTLGGTWSTVVQLVCLGAVLTMLALRGRISTIVRLSAYSACGLAFALIGLIKWGLAGQGLLIIVLVLSLSSVGGLRYWFCVAAACVLAAAAVAWAFVTGRLELVDAATYMRSPGAWATAIITMSVAGYTARIWEQISKNLFSRTEALRTREQQIRTISGVVPFAFYRRRQDAGWTMLSLDAPILQITGHPAADFIGGANRAFVDVVHPDDAPWVELEVRAAVEARQPWAATYRVLHADGSSRWVLDRGTAALEQADGAQADGARSDGERSDGEQAEGQQLTGFLLDVTEQKLAEHQRAGLEEQLRQAQKMEAVGRLAGGVAHDFNNLLTGINGNAEMLLEDLSPEDPARESVEEILRTGERAGEVITQLLAFSRKQVISPRVIDPNAVLDSSMKMLRRLIGEQIALAFLPAEPAWRVRLDPTQLDQILVNLAVNARDAMPGGGELTIEVHNVPREEAPLMAEGDAAVLPGDYVMLSVGDSGSGMDEETRAHIFEPFFSTKPKGQGTGLGLATIYGIVRQNGGLIRVTSEPGQGTAFKIFFPRVTEAADVRAVARPDPLPRGDETILLVEDEDVVRRLARRMLAELGYQVLEAADGEAACADFAQRARDGEIQLLVTDVVMPRMNGKELHARLQELVPGLKVLYISGYTDEVVAHHGVLEEGSPLLQKPFTRAALASKVRDVLDG